MPFRQHARRRLETGIDAEPGGPDQLIAVKKQRRALPGPRRHPGFLEKILQRAPRALRVRLQPLAAGAQANLEALELAVDAAAAAPEANFAGQRWNREPRLALPGYRLERPGLGGFFDRHISPISA